MTAESKPSAVLVEDDAAVLRALRCQISTAGFDVVTFDRPSAVLAATLPASKGVW